MEAGSDHAVEKVVVDFGLAEGSEVVDKSDLVVTLVVEEGRLWCHGVYRSFDPQTVRHLDP